MNGNATKKRAAPWAIRGIPAEARNAAIAASRREGITLGEWLDRAIRQQVKAERSQPPGPTLEETIARLAESMTQQAQAMEGTRQQNAAIMARVEAVERGRDRRGMAGEGSLFMRLYGLLRGRQAASDRPA
jgi:hypothetical protein